MLTAEQKRILSGLGGYGGFGTRAELAEQIGSYDERALDALLRSGHVGRRRGMEEAAGVDRFGAVPEELFVTEAGGEALGPSSEA